MQAIDVMDPMPVTVNPDDTVSRAAELMIAHRISGLPVVDDNGVVVGVISEGDLLHRVENDTDHNRSLWREMFISPHRLATEFVKATGRRVRDVMTREVVTVEEAALLADIADLFERRHIKRVPVLREGKLVGIVSRADLVRALLGSGTARAGDMRIVEFS